jgi:hypothetical protein
VGDEADTVAVGTYIGCGEWEMWLTQLLWEQKLVVVVIDDTNTVVVGEIGCGGDR